MYLNQESQDIIGIFLKEYRNKAGLNQLSVAIKLGYSSPQFISNWERGLAMPPLQTMKKLLQIYKIPKKNLIGVLLREIKKSIDAEL